MPKVRTETAGIKFVLELTLEEASALAALTGHVGGVPSDGHPRADLCNIAYGVKNRASSENIKLEEYSVTGSVYINKL